MRWMSSLFGIGLMACASAATAQASTSTLRRIERITKQNDQNEISRKLYRDAFGDGPAPKWRWRTPSSSSSPVHAVRSGLTKYDLCSLDAAARHQACFRGHLVPQTGSPDLAVAGYTSR